MTLTSNDLTKVKGIVKEEIHAQEKRLEKMIDEKLEEKLDEKLTQLKSDFYEKIDPILKEVVDARETEPSQTIVFRNWKTFTPTENTLSRSNYLLW